MAPRKRKILFVAWFLKLWDIVSRIVSLRYTLD